MLFAEVPPEIAGLPTWFVNGLSIGSLVSLIIGGLMSSRLWTKRQVDEMVKQHEREVADLKNRYEMHIAQTVELLQGRADDARTRENEWRDVAQKWQNVAEMLASGLEPLQDQGETMLRLLQAWQSEMQRRALGQ